MQYFLKTSSMFLVNLRENTYCMHVQHVDAQIVGCQIHGLKDFAECHSFVVFGTSNNFISVILQRFFDKSKQVFLIHTRSRVYVSIDL